MEHWFTAGTENRLNCCLSKTDMEDTGLFQRVMWKEEKPRLQTALREVKEETGLDISLQSGFRHAVEYFPRPNVKKQVVYFLGEATSNDLHMQEEEISRIIWMDIHKAYHMVTFKNDKNLIWMAGKRLQ